MPCNKPELYHIKDIIQETKTVKSLSFYFPPARKANPGQFLMVWIPGVDEIPMSVASVDGSDVKIQVAKVGEATKALHREKVGGYIGLRGPYGRGYSLKGYKHLLVGGGVGSAPLLYLAEKLRERNKSVTVLLGAKTREELLNEKRFVDLGCEVKVTTEDGSKGHRGLVTHLLPKLLEKEKEYRIKTCGPEPMMKAVYEIAKKYNCQFPVEASIERIMKCGIGLCNSCDCGGHNICKDGPVLNLDFLIKNTEFSIFNRKADGSRNYFSDVRMPNPEIFIHEYDALLESKVNGVVFPRPTMTAAGFSMSGMRLYRSVLKGAGAVVTKSFGLEPNNGYHGSNCFITRLGPINAMGLPNPGIKNIDDEIRDATRARVPLVESFYVANEKEAEEITKYITRQKILPSIIEFDGSCKHSEKYLVEKDPEILYKITRTIKTSCKDIPLWVKISLNFDYVINAERAVNAGADGITFSNTETYKPVDNTLNIPILGSPTGFGGLSGKRLVKKVLKGIHELYETNLRVPLIVAGGIGTTPGNSLDFVEEGASLLQIGSAQLYYDLDALNNENEAIRRYLIDHGMKNINELVGVVHKR